MHGLAAASHRLPVRVLDHIKRVDDCFGDFLVRVIYPCGAVREIPPQSPARIARWNVLLKNLAPRMRCSRCGRKAAGLVAIATEFCAIPSGGHFPSDPVRQMDLYQRWIDWLQRFL
jgi:hypothetical protein